MRFIILANHRTGSTLLESYLNCNKNTPCKSELFQTNINHPLSVPRYIEWRRFYRKSVGHYIKKYVPANGGFKLMYGQLAQYPALQKYLETSGTLIIHLKRKNLLRRYVSLRLAQETNKWSSNTGKMKLHTIKLDPEKTPKSLEKSNMQVQKNTIYQKTNPYLEVTYEELSDHPDETLARIWHSLNEKPVKLTTALEKQNPYPLQQIIINYQEIEAVLLGTEFEWMLTDV